MEVTKSIQEHNYWAPGTEKIQSNIHPSVHRLVFSVSIMILLNYGGVGVYVYVCVCVYV